MPTKQDLERRAHVVVRGVWNDPQGRLALREAFYRKHGHAHLLSDADRSIPEALEFGFGRSEIDFLRWEVERGVLDPDGSAWWRGVNGDFIYWSELAGMASEAGMAGLDWELPVRHWLDYLASPGAMAWYRAHNTSILEGYRARVGEARTEPETEQVFINIVLYRLLFAQVLVQDVLPFGELDRVLADPRLPAVRALVSVPDFYPKDYPLTPEEFAAVTGHGGFSLAEIAVRILDGLLIGPHLAEIYQAAGVWNGVPAVTTMLTDGKPTYPVGVEPIPTPNPDRPAAGKQKIVILGGGIASLAAAWELTSYEGWQNDYEITLYQLGWRCGGKAGGGRGVHGRVEELGLHLLLGFYVNAFPMFQEAYEERTRRNLWPTARYPTLPDAIAPNWGALLVNYDAKARVWNNWPMIFPPSPGYPGDGPPLSTWQLLKRGAGILLETLLGSPYGEEIGPVARWILDHFFPAGDADTAPPAHDTAHERLPGVLAAVREAADALDEEVHRILGEIEVRGAQGPTTLEGLVGHLGSLLAWLRRRIEGAEQNLLHLWWLLDFGFAMLTGIVKDVWDPRTRTFQYRKINDLDFRAWLGSHGASRGTLFSPMVTFFYTGTFEALADGKDQGGLLAAGTALQFAIPALGYKGSFMFQLRLGTADTLVMPLYQVLAARGVRFEFFCEATNLPWSGTGQIDSIELSRQVDLVVPTYDPVIDVEGNPCWPSAPRYEQIDPEQAKRLQEEHIDLESPWSGWQGKPFTLRRGVDYDLVLLGIPSKAQRTLCREIIANRPDWGAMVDNIATAQVMSAQLWLTPTLAGLGYVPGDWGMPEENAAPNVVTYQNPMFSWLDQSYILPNEAWPTADPGNVPRVLAMFTGILPNPPEVPPPGKSDFPERETARARSLTWQWLMDNMGWFFPKAQTPAYPRGIDLTLLASTDGKATGALEKYAQQWFTTAVAPTNQYVIAVPGTERYRMQPGASGFENLYLVGDWTDYGVNIGYMEGCVVSAKEAVECLRERVFQRTDHRTFHRDREADWRRARP